MYSVKGLETMKKAAEKVTGAVTLRAGKQDAKIKSLLINQSIVNQITGFTDNKFYISTSNGKLGAIASFNLPPVVSCGTLAKGKGGCASTGCYACKNYSRAGYDSNITNAWNHNLIYVKTDLNGLQAGLNSYLKKYTGRFFRIHSSGDFYNYNYMIMWYNIIKNNPGIRFLIFTKRFDLVKKADSEGYNFYKLNNCSLYISGWSNYSTAEKAGDLLNYYPVAECAVNDSEVDAYTEKGFFKCPGSCEACLYCFAGTKGDNTVFKKH